MEASSRHRLLEARVVGQGAGIEDEVAVLGRFGERHVSSARVEVDRLSADDRDLVDVFAQREERVEERRSCGNEDVIGARHLRSPPSSPAALRLPLGCVPGRS
jgi:hypothetical protein